MTAAQADAMVVLHAARGWAEGQSRASDSVAGRVNSRAALALCRKGLAARDLIGNRTTGPRRYRFKLTEAGRAYANAADGLIG